MEHCFTLNQNIMNHFAVIRIPHQTPAELHFDVEPRQLFDWDSEVQFLKENWEYENPEVPFEEPSEIVLDGVRYRKGDYMYSTYWDDAGTIVFDSEEEMKDYLENTLKGSGLLPGGGQISHQSVRVASLISNYFENN